MAPTYKLTYFDFRGLGEPIRYLLHQGGVEFEDYRLPKEEWPLKPELKAQMPFGKLPTLEIDGKKVHQTVVICRYLGKQFKLAGENDWENMEIEIIADTITDMKATTISYFLAKNDPASTAESVAKLKAVALNETMPYFLSRFEEIVKTNKGYFVNGKLTWVDLYWAAFIDVLGSMLAVDLLTDYPNLLALRQRVNDLPAIKAWLAKRPKSDI